MSKQFKRCISVNICHLSRICRRGIMPYNPIIAPLCHRQRIACSRYVQFRSA